MLENTSPALLTVYGLCYVIIGLVIECVVQSLFFGDRETGYKPSKFVVLGWPVALFIVTCMMIGVLAEPLIFGRKPKL